MTDEKYHEVIAAYQHGRPISEIADKVKLSKVKVQRILITEELWTSKRTKQIARMRAEGKSVKEIAEILDRDVKTIETFLPYSKGQYGGADTDDAKRVKAYRSRKQFATENMTKEDSEMAELVHRSALMKYQAWNDYMEKQKIELEANPFKNEFSVYRVQFNLCSGFYYGAKDDMDLEDADRDDFRLYAKTDEGISREVLIPGDMNLHALHYMIQRLFGWQNSHLHHFSLRQEDFMSLTEGKVGGWLSLCGKLLRFPTDDLEDLYWDDDYSGDISVKNWLKTKYKAPYRDKARADSLKGNLGEVNEFRERFPDVPDDMMLEELQDKVVFEADFNMLMESLTLHELLPAFGDLYYLYDYGDDWCVHITMLDKYDRKTNADLTKGGFFVVDILNRKDGLTKYRYFQRTGESEIEVNEELRAVLAEVDVKSKPRCVAAEGLSVFDDVGGIHGYLDFLRIMNRGGAVEKYEMREWARGLGWTGRITKPENMV